MLDNLSCSFTSIPLLTNKAPAPFYTTNSTHGEVYAILHYVIEFVSDLRQVGSFLRYSGFLHQKTDRHDITEILLLKVTLNTITPKPYYYLDLMITT